MLIPTSNHWSRSISKLLGKSIKSIKIERIKKGFSDKSYRLIISTNGVIETYFLKEIENKSESIFYKKVVFAVGIPTPQLYGVLSLDSKTYMLTEYIESLKTRWNVKQRYFRAIDLLIEKDLLVQINWKKIKQSKFVKSEVSYNRIIQDISRIHEGKKLKIHSSYNKLSRFLISNKFKMRYVQNILSNRGKLTLCHNDFHLNNLIFSKIGKRVYLIDWKDPNIGSVYIDLATIVNNAPREYQLDLLKYYKSKVQTKAFNYLYPIAEAHDHLGVLSWAVKAAKTQKTRVLKYIDYGYKTKRIIQAILNLS